MRLSQLSHLSQSKTLEGEARVRCRLPLMPEKVHRVLCDLPLVSTVWAHRLALVVRGGGPSVFGLSTPETERLMRCTWPGYRQGGVCPDKGHIGGLSAGAWVGGVEVQHTRAGHRPVSWPFMESENYPPGV